MSATAQDMRERLKRWPLIQQPGNRGPDFLHDQRLVNAYAERDPDSGEWEVIKRFGYTSAYTIVNPSNAAGMYTWFPVASAIPVPSSYAITSGSGSATLFKDGVSFQTGLTPANTYYFTETQPPGSGTRYLVMMSGGGIVHLSTLYYTDGTNWFTPTGPAGKGKFCAGLAYLDSTVYFMDENCAIWGSGLNDPGTWNALNVIYAQSVPGLGIGFVKQLSYLLALKTNSMEVFYDNGNPTGSPLSQVPGATNGFGCADRDSVQTLDDIVFYITANRGYPQVVQVDNLAPSIISTPNVDRLIGPWQQQISLGSATNSFVFKHGGHRFYGISSSGLNLALIYDIDQKLWYQWTDSSGNYFPMAAVGVNASYQHQFLHATNGQVYTFDVAENQPTDNGVVTPVDIYTPNMDFGTRRQKTLHRMYMNADQTPGSLLYVRRSDTDYQSWSNFKKVDLSRRDPYIGGEGTFTRRAYHFRHSAPTSFRMRSVDLQMELGTI